jgi:hypothetical protein
MRRWRARRAAPGLSRNKKDDDARPSYFGIKMFSAVRQARLVSPKKDRDESHLVVLIDGNVLERFVRAEC